MQGFAKTTAGQMRSGAMKRSNGFGDIAGQVSLPCDSFNPLWDVA